MAKVHTLWPQVEAQIVVIKQVTVKVPIQQLFLCEKIEALKCTPNYKSKDQPPEGHDQLFLCKAN